MQLLTRTPGRHYFIAIFLVVSALFVTFSTVIYRYQTEAQYLNDWTLYNYEVVRQSRQVLFDLVEMETGVRGYLLTGKRSFLKPYETARRNLTEHSAQLQRFTKSDPTTPAYLGSWMGKAERFSMMLQHQVESVNSNSSISQLALERQREQMESLRQVLESQIQKRLQDLGTQLAASRAKQDNFQYFLMLGATTAIVCMFLVTLAVLALFKRSRRAEESLRTVEGRFLAVMHGIDDGLFDVNLRKRTVYYSPAFKTMLGYGEKDDHPNTFEMFDKLLHPDDQQYSLSYFLEAKAENLTNYSQVYRLRRKDGNWCWVLARAVGLTDGRGRVTRVLGTHTDITEHKRREEALEQLSNEMETFTYVTSHDLRAPLVNMKGFATEMEHALGRIKPVVMREDLPLSDEERQVVTQVLDEDFPESLRFIKKAVERMDALTGAVLNLSKIGKREYVYTPVDSAEIVRRCLDTLSYEISQKHIDVRIEHLPVIVTDALALEQIFSNLIDNAVKYLDPSRPGKIIIAAEEGVNQTVFTVKDNGRGIAESDKDKVFQIFRRARNTESIRGLGIGMAFVQASLRQLGGTIWLYSTPNIGTTFHFRLPKRHVSRLDRAA